MGAIEALLSELWLGLSFFEKKKIAFLILEKSNNPKSKILVPWVTGWQWRGGSGMAV
jgi:hypothetical protein